MSQKMQRPALIFSVCALPDIPKLELWEAHLCPLQKAGILDVRSIRHVQPGTDRRKLLSHHLDQADLIVLLLSADFFTDNECEALMQDALLRHQQGSTRLIPLLLRPVAWQETPLGMLTVVPSDGRPVTQWPDPEVAFSDCIRQLSSIIGFQPLPQQIQENPRGELNRVRMRERLQRIYEDLLTQSLQGVTLMELRYH